MPCPAPKSSVSASDQFAADTRIPAVNVVTAVVPTDLQALVQPMRELSQRALRVFTVDQTIANTSFDETEITTYDGSEYIGAQYHPEGRRDRPLDPLRPSRPGRHLPEQ